MTNAAPRGKPDAGNPHVRFDEGEVAPAATPRRGSLLYNIKCPHCGTEYEVEREWYGLYTTCESCGKGFVVGTSGRPHNNMAKEKLENIIKATCPYCGVLYEMGREWYGKMVACDACGKHFTIGISKFRQALNAGSDQKTVEARKKDDYAARKFFSLHGRAGRKEYWITSLVTTLLLTVIGVLACVELSTSSEDFNETVGILALVNIILITPVSVRRLHDLNLSGWFVLVIYLLQLIPIRGTSYACLYLLGIQKGTQGDNAFGSDPLLK